MGHMKTEDYQLSMFISPRGKLDSTDLRQLLVNRLSDTYKAVLRRPLRRPGKCGVFCESCKRWTQQDHTETLFVCPRCERSYRIELIVYEEIETEGSDEAHG